jgi:hypothetical protein
MINVLRRWWNPALFIKSEEEWMNLEKKAGFKEIIQHSAGWQVQRIWKKVSPIAEITS